MTRVLVCGGRDYADREFVFEVLRKYHEENVITCIIEGGASGVDRYVATFAMFHGIEHITFLAEWSKYGKTAGPMRNREMLEKGKPNVVIAFKGGDETRDMIRKATETNIPVIKEGW
jgi:beta-galactosidase GanA